MSDEEVLTGGLPPACLGAPDGVAEWFRGYVQTYVERDVRQLSRITDLVSFRTLAQLAALRTGQVLSISSLARDAKLTAVTAGRYLDLLEASFLIRRLPPFLKNRSSRLVKSPKLHFTDSGHRDRSPPPRYQRLSNEKTNKPVRQLPSRKARWLYDVLRGRLLLRGDDVVSRFESVPGELYEPAALAHEHYHRHGIHDCQHSRQRECHGRPVPSGGRKCVERPAEEPHEHVASREVAHPVSDLLRERQRVAALHQHGDVGRNDLDLEEDDRAHQARSGGEGNQVTDMEASRGRQTKRLDGAERLRVHRRTP